MGSLLFLLRVQIPNGLGGPTRAMLADWALEVQPRLSLDMVLYQFHKLAPRKPGAGAIGDAGGAD